MHRGLADGGAQGSWALAGLWGRFNTCLFSPLQPPKPSDLSIVCFTSGTTGKQRHSGHQPGHLHLSQQLWWGAWRGLWCPVWARLRLVLCLALDVGSLLLLPVLSIGWLDVDGQCELGGRGWGVSHFSALKPEEGWAAGSRCSCMGISSHHPAASWPCLAFVSRIRGGVWGLVSESHPLGGYKPVMSPLSSL